MSASCLLLRASAHAGPLATVPFLFYLFIFFVVVLFFGSVYDSPFQDTFANPSLLHRAGLHPGNSSSFCLCTSIPSATQ